MKIYQFSFPVWACALALTTLTYSGCNFRSTNTPRPENRSPTLFEQAVVRPATYADELTLESTGLILPAIPKDLVAGTTPVKQKSVGLNAHPWNDFAIFPGIHAIRCYISSQYAWQPGGLFVQPMAQAYTETTHGFDDYFQRAVDQQVDVIATIHQTPEWYVNTGRGDGGNNNAPGKIGVDRTKPAFYKDYAAFLWQFTARYGRVKYADSLLRVDQTAQYPNQPKNGKKSGLGTLTYIEPWNEEKWWKLGTPEYIQPEEMAALMSAVYDGHEGALGAGVGIKTADSSMVVLMPGLTDFDLAYTVAMDEWFKAHRKDKKWPCDILNYHHYSNLGNTILRHPPAWIEGGGCFPAEDKNFLTVRQVVAFARRLDKPLWITECGYDTRSPSPMHLMGKGMTDEQAQGEALVATCKAYFAEGVERVFIFTGPEEPGNTAGGLWQTSGVVGNAASGYKPKAALRILADYIGSLK